MDKVTQTNASSAEETAAASQELRTQAGALRQVVAELQRLMGGVASDGATPAEIGSEDPHPAPAGGATTSSLSSAPAAAAH